MLVLCYAEPRWKGLVLNTGPVEIAAQAGRTPSICLYSG